MKSLLACVALFGPTLVGAQTYRIAAEYPLGGTGSYDYLRYDAHNSRVFVSHQTEVDVVDAVTGKLTAKIPGLHGVHGIVLVPSLGRGFISTGLDGQVTAFDLANLKVTGSFKTGGDKPDAIEFDKASGLLLVSNGHSNSVSLIDAATGTLKFKVAVLGNPESIALDGEGHAFVNLESHNSVAQLDLATGKILSDWPVGPGEGPTGLALDRAHHRLIVTCGGNGKMVILDSAKGAQVAVLPIGDDSDAVSFNPGNGRIFSSNRDGTLTIVQEDDADHFRVLQTLTTQFGARTNTLDAKGDRLFLPVAKFTPGKDEDHPGPTVPDTFKLLVVTQ